MINYNKLKKLPVKTVSGVLLGRVKDLEIDVDNLNLVKLVVRTSWCSSLLVNVSQVVRITADELVVKDNLAEEKPVNEIKEVVETVLEAPTMEEQS